MYLCYGRKNGVEYGKVCCSHWVDGKDRKTYINLGRVIDKQNHIFKNRKRGLFRYDPEQDLYFDVDESKYSSSPVTHSPSLILSFGDVWFLNEYLKSTGLLECLKAVDGQFDTVVSLVMYYILNQLALVHAQDWYESSYVSYLYPKARMDSQRLSEQLSLIGSEESYRSFFKSYIGWMKNDQENIDNILVDSTGLPNSIHFPLTAVSNHNGKISNEIRLIYVTQEETGIPIYLRYVCGSIPDVLTIPATIKELKEMSVPIKEVLLDAGYYSEKNVIRLYTENVKFVCRVKENLRLFKELVSIHRKEIENQDNLVKFGKRLVFIKARAVNLAPNCPGYAYICLDLARRASESMNMLNHLDPDSGTSTELFEKLESEGFFILASSNELAIEEILPVYYTRQQVEQTFDIGKNYTGLLPVRIQSEDRLRGHLLITFIASMIVKRIQLELLNHENKRTKKLNPISLFQNLGYQRCSVFEDKIIIHEADSKANQGYKLFKIKVPEELNLGSR